MIENKFNLFKLYEVEALLFAYEMRNEQFKKYSHVETHQLVSLNQFFLEIPRPLDLMYLFSTRHLKHHNRKILTHLGSIYLVTVVLDVAYLATLRLCLGVWREREGRVLKKGKNWVKRMEGFR